MGLTLTPQGDDMPVVVGDRRMWLGTVTGDSASARGGEAIVAEDFGMQRVHSFLAAPTNKGRTPYWDSANGKLRYLASNSPRAVEKITQRFAYTDAVDVTTTGTVTLRDNVPAGAIVLGYSMRIHTGFTNDTSATIQVGTVGDLDAFSADTAQSAFTSNTTAASLAIAADAFDGIGGARNVVVTITTAADYTSVNAGSATIELYYIDTATSPIVTTIEQDVAFGDFTAATTTGTLTLNESLPAGAIPLGWTMDVSTGFTNDTSAVARIGTTGDNDRFSADTGQSVFTAGNIVGSAVIAADALDGVSAVSPLIVTITTNAAYSSVNAGAAKVRFFYIDPALTDQVQSASKSGTYATFTDGTSTTGSLAFATGAVPARSIPLGWVATVGTAWTGTDATTATVIVGVSGDTDRFSADNAKSVATAGTVGSMALAADALDSFAGKVTPLITVTEADDYTDFEAGTISVELFYIEVGAEYGDLSEIPAGTDLSEDVSVVQVIGQ